MKNRFQVGDTVEIFDGDLYEEDRLSCLVPGVQGVITEVGHDYGNKGWDYKVRFDNLRGPESDALYWWLYESELNSPFENVDLGATSLL